MDPMLMGLAVPAAPDPGIIDPHVFTLYADAYNAVALPLEDATTAIILSLLNYLHGPLKAFIIFWLASTGVAMALASEAWPIQKFFNNVIRAAIVYFLIANTANYNHYISDPLLHMLPQEIGQAIAGAIGGG